MIEKSITEIKKTTCGEQVSTIYVHYSFRIGRVVRLNPEKNELWLDALLGKEPEKHFYLAEIYPNIHPGDFLSIRTDVAPDAPAASVSCIACRKSVARLA